MLVQRVMPERTFTYKTRLICSKIILNYLNLHNACYLLSEAIHYNAMELAKSIKSYMAANMEMLLEPRILDDLDKIMVRHLAEYTCTEQLIHRAMDKHKAWLALQDIPGPIVPNSKPSQEQRELQKTSCQTIQMPTPSPSLKPTRPSRSIPHLDLADDDIFLMDDTEPQFSGDSKTSQASSSVIPQPTPTPCPVWKSNTLVLRYVRYLCFWLWY